MGACCWVTGAAHPQWNTLASLQSEREKRFRKQLLVVTKDSVNTVLNLSRRFDAIGENKDGGGKSLARFNVSAPLHSGYDLVRCKLIEVKAQESLQAI
uniref:Uncharacterized protein n=1 Tax=Vespula pensylvanica TaxID=30213 RepID=A0A834UFG2_VESPE|nr:hypothetical protein H0235_003586 [Vespula pensylvanica]